MQRFTPLLADAARFARHSPGDSWHVDGQFTTSLSPADLPAFCPAIIE
ncbi:hypothetical protein Pme01_23890 [Planosporangium mesophilum]|uniref:Uncharacterized protein n=1 Tax=Planosporangium mesophilum TaxID=689768 RepID=A0A8J3X011_9ACTN|nr:hypothetical protein Pme01_23890 [Planosporangium mesophilum]